MEMQPLCPTDEHATYFKLFVKSLVLKFNPLQIYCFAQTTYLERSKSCFLKQDVNQKYNYCLLLVTQSITRIDYEVQDYSNAHYKQGTITILCHGIETIKEATKANNRFFITVCNHGKLIYTNDGMSGFDIPDRFIPTQGAIKAKKHFDYRIPLAEGFLVGAGECISKEQYNVCVFMLHQVTEQVCIALIRVNMAYRSEIHNLHRLLRLCTCFSDKPLKAFLSGSMEDERLFNILLKSYSEARYRDTFLVLPDDAWLLYNKTLAFVALAKDICQEKIMQLELQAKQYKEFAGESEATDE